MEQLTGNIDIWRTIFNYLKPNEQVAAAQVCPEFQYIVVNYMWRYKYRHIKVYKLNGNTFIMSASLQADEGKCDFVMEYFVALEHKEFEKFLNLNAKNIIELELCDYRSDELIGDEQFCTENRWSFPNLEKLVLQFIRLDAKELEMIFKNCKKLETLHLKECLNTNFELITLHEEDNCDYDALMKILKVLKEFQLDYREAQLSNSSLSLHDLLLNKNLNNLNLNVPLANLRYKETPRLRMNSCETLRIGNFNENKILQKFARLYLNSFHQLLSLTVEGSVNKVLIETQFIENLSQACPLLRNLNFKRCLMNVDDFGLLSSITDISLDCCMSLTWSNLKQLLELPLLSSFVTNNSTYTRELENVFVPLNLKSLTMIGNEFRFAQIFSNPQLQLTNLKQLIYYDGSDNRIVGISQKFPNLEVLHIPPHHVHQEDLFHLKKLKTFKTHKCPETETNFLGLLHLIKHPALRQLSITSGSCDFGNQLSIDLSDVNNTKLRSLTLDFELFNYMFEFFLDLLNKNVKLKLIVISEEIATFQYYFELVSKRKFCRNFIMLCGFQIGN